MNILFVCEGLNSFTAVAQPWRHVVEISKRIKKLGNDVRVLSDYQKGLNRDDEIQSVPIRRIPKKGLLFDIEELQRSINQESFDVINWHCSDTWSSIYLWRLRKRIKKNIVWTLHSGPLSIKDFRNLSLREVICLHKYWNNLLNAALPTSILRKWAGVPQLKHIIVPSKRLSRYLESIGIAKEKIGVIPSGVDTRIFGPPSHIRLEQLKENLGFGNEPLIFYFGPISTFRGIDTMIAAMPIIQGRIADARLVVLGRTRETKDRAWLRRAKGSARVTPVMRILEQKALIEYMSLADVVVLPFKFWPQVECPLTVLESMAMEKPLVTTSVGAIPEIVHDGQNGILIPPKNPTEIAEKVLLLLRDEELRVELGKKARKHVEKLFDWRIIVRRTLRVFSQIADNNWNL